MNREEFKDWASNIRIFDGSIGTALINRGMPGYLTPDKFVLENPDVLISLQEEYIKAGAEVVLSATFGANSSQMKIHDLDDIEYVNRELIKISKKAANGKALVAAQLGPTGELMAPMGTMSFDETIKIYKEQVKYCLNEKPDLFILETFFDLTEIRAAVIAVRELSDLPIIASMSFKNMATVFGNTPEAVAVTLEAAGADSVGANCSTGPKDIAGVIERMAKVTNLPLFAKPNAGIPELIDDNTTYHISTDEFSELSLLSIKAGAALIGGCCGTKPIHIKKLKETLKDVKPIKQAYIKETYLSSPKEILKISGEDKFIPIGERINPTGQKELAKAFVSGNINNAISLAEQQINAGAKILDINTGAAGADERQLLKNIAEVLPSHCPAPLCFDTSNTSAMEAALRSYCGRALLNSASAEQDRMEPMIKIAAKYGAVIILLPFSGKPNLTCEDRIDTLTRLLECCQKYGVDKNSIVVDAAVMTIATDTCSAKQAIEFVKYLKENDYLSVAGVSNVSYGLPNRQAINNAFLAQLIDAGLTLGIVRPSKSTNNIIDCAYLLSSKDEYCMNWINNNR